MRLFRGWHERRSVIHHQLQRCFSFLYWIWWSWVTWLLLCLDIILVGVFMIIYLYVSNTCQMLDTQCVIACLNSLSYGACKEVSISQLLGLLVHELTIFCEQVRIQCEPGGRLVIAGMPEDPENPWGVTPFRKVSIFS